MGRRSRGEEKKEEAARNAKKKKRKQREKFAERFQKYYQARKQALAKRRDAMKQARIPPPPTAAPRGFAGVVPAVSYALTKTQEESKVKPGHGTKRIVSL